MSLHCTGASARGVRGVRMGGHARRTGCSGLASQPPPALACQRPLSPPAKGLPLQVPWCQSKCHRGMGPMPPSCLAHCARSVGMTLCGSNRMGVDAEGEHTPGLLEGRRPRSPRRLDTNVEEQDQPAGCGRAEVNRLVLHVRPKGGPRPISPVPDRRTDSEHRRSRRAAEAKVGTDRRGPALEVPDRKERHLLEKKGECFGSTFRPMPAETSRQHHAE